MKVLKVIVDEMARNCWDCIMTGNGNYCPGIKDLIPASGNKPDNCPLEVETDGWIAVEERLPEPIYFYYDTLLKPQDMLLLMRNDNKILVGAYVKYGTDCQHRGWIDDELFYMPYDKVTHWRPLPHRQR